LEARLKLAATAEQADGSRVSVYRHSIKKKALTKAGTRRWRPSLWRGLP
jgi:hypothetical protein